MAAHIGHGDCEHFRTDVRIRLQDHVLCCNTMSTEVVVLYGILRPTALLSDELYKSSRTLRHAASDAYFGGIPNIPLLQLHLTQGLVYGLLRLIISTRTCP